MTDVLVSAPGLAGEASPGGKADSPNSAWLRALERSARLGREPGLTLPILVDEVAARHGARPALLSSEQSFSYAALAARARSYARWALWQGIGAGDVVGLMMRNCPEYAAIWLGITRVGGIVALLNTNQVADALVHAVAAAAPVQLIIGVEFVAAVAPIRDRLPATLRIWVRGAAADGMDELDAEIEGDRDGPLPTALATPALRDTALYIYTSGTTGLPKAARVSHCRIMQWSLWFVGADERRARGPDLQLPADVPQRSAASWRSARCCWRRVGGAAGEVLGAANSGTMCARWDCTLFQYIGELCRYLVNAPPHPARRAHRLRLACGNGLRAEIWEKFRARFAIPRILEFYAATEGNVSLFNVEGKPGAIGRVPPFWRIAFPAALVRSTSRRRTGARRRTASAALRAPARSARPRADRANGRYGGAASRAMPMPTLPREEDPARRVRAGRRLVPHRRPDAQGREAAISISSTASATPSAGRARMSPPSKWPR